MAQRSDFATTRWTVVLQAGRHAEDPEARRALEQLCQEYWPPLYSYVRRRVPQLAEAQDLTQSFFAELLEKKVFGQARADRADFAPFLSRR